MSGRLLAPICLKKTPLNLYFAMGNHHSSPLLLVFPTAGSISEHSQLLSGTALSSGCGGPKQHSFPGHGERGRMGWEARTESALGYLGVIQSLIPQCGQGSAGSSGGKGKRGADSQHWSRTPASAVAPCIHGHGLGRFLGESVSVRDIPLSHWTENIC